MKKIMATLLTVLACGTVCALPVGNPSEASLFTTGHCWGDDSSCCPWGGWARSASFRFGFYGDYVFDKDMEARKQNAFNDKNDLEEATIHTNAAYLALNFCDRVDLFATLGATKINFEGNSNFADFNSTGTSIRAQWELSSAFSWSIGGRATLLECNCFAVGLEGQYFRTRPDMSRRRSNFYQFYIPEGPNDTVNSEVEFAEWQWALGISYSFCCDIFNLVPYTAVKWSRAVFNSDYTEIGGIPLPDLLSKKPWGYAVGATIDFCDMLGITLEGRFGAERAFYLNGQVRF